MYQYRPEDQGGMQYGNQTRTYAYDESDNLYRIQMQSFNPNESAWIVNKPLWSAAFDGAWNTLSASFYHYDGRDWQDDPGDQGKLTLTRARLLTPGASCPKTEQTVDTSYAYDAYGNLKTATSYEGYGWVHCDMISNWSGSTPGNGSTSRATTTSYDSTYHLYPLQACNALNQCGHSEYYGVDGVPADYGLPGQARRAWGANGADTATEYRYDAFGRLTHVIRPDDSPSMPTVRYYYSDGPAPVNIQTWQQEVSGVSDATRPTFNFYDGLGRLLQSRVETQNDSQQTVVNSAYDALGRVVWTHVPTFEGYSSSFSRPSGWDARPATITQYDALGRVVQVTNPDNSTVKSAYNGWRTAVLDANGHQKIQEMDAFGRLVKVHEYDETYTNVNWSATPYATTEYDYDRLDNLTLVADKADNVTTMEYDALGRKTDMSDPDMGDWEYTYTPAGSLDTQTGARGCETSFGYDELNRLESKNYGAGCTSTAAVSYSYDQGAYGIGYRTGMSDGSGSATWSYDKRGRVTQGSKTINGDGGGTFVTQWDYDAMDRGTQMTYPDGEQVDYSYNNFGLLNDVVGDDTYVQGSSYDASGRVELRKLGNDVLRTDYVYYPWSTANGLGRLQQLLTGTPSDPDSLQDLRYSYDTVGNVLSILDNTAGPQMQSFDYDALDRLVKAEAMGGSHGAYDEEEYVYNVIGNLTNKAGIDYTYPISGLNSTQPHAVTSTSDGRSYQYDENGNQTQRVLDGDIYALSYDAENRLTVVEKNGSEVATFVYDGDGARVRKESGDNITVYVGQHYEQESGLTELELPDPGFEQGGAWSHVPSGSWPGSSIWRGAWGTGAPHSGSYATSISNLHYGYARSPFINVTPGQSYELSAYVRGESDPDDSYHKWILRASFYDANGAYLSYLDAYSNYSVGASWTRYAGNVSAPAGAYQMKVEVRTQMLSGWVAFDDVAVKQGSSTIYSDGFESDDWDKIASSAFPATSVWRGTWGIAGPRSGGYAMAISNLHWGWVLTPKITTNPFKSYTVKVYARGEIDPDSSPSQSQGGNWMIRAYWYDRQGNSLGYDNLRAQDTVAGSWTLYSNSFTPPFGTWSVKIGLGSELQSGWIAFDDLSIEYSEGETERLYIIPVPNPEPIYSSGFESGDDTWSNSKSSAFPATSIWNGAWGTASPHSGSRAVVISNHAYGYLNSSEIAVQPNTTYYLSAWLRGEIDSEESYANWILRAYYYDANHSGLSYTNVDLSSTAPSSWTERGGDFTTPANAAYVRVQLYNYMNSGWVAWDDVSLTGAGVTTRKYYYAGATRVAMREDDDLYFLLGDHLGSTAVTANSDGGKEAELRYRAFGEMRYTDGDTPTERRFTGQIEDGTIGLYFYNARYYDASLGRFVQADTIVPNPADPQSLNRYSYVLNNPLKYTDPSGHCIFGLDTAVCIAVGAAVVGAVAGGSIAYGTQVVQNKQSGMSWGDALTTDIDVGKVAGGAAGGTVVALTFHFVGPITTMGFWKTVTVGGVASLGAGQASAIVEATTDELVAYIQSGSNFDTANVWENALELGLFDPESIVVDAASGAVSAAFAYPIARELSRIAKAAGLIESVSENPVWTLSYMPTLGNSAKMVAGQGRTITLGPDEFNALWLMLGRQLAPKAFRWLWSGADWMITETLGED